MSDDRPKRETMSVEEVTVSNMWGIAAIVEVLEQKGGDFTMDESTQGSRHPDSLAQVFLWALLLTLLLILTPPNGTYAQVVVTNITPATIASFELGTNVDTIRSTGVSFFAGVEMEKTPPVGSMVEGRRVSMCTRRGSEAGSPSAFDAGGSSTWAE